MLPEEVSTEAFKRRSSNAPSDRSRIYRPATTRAPDAAASTVFSVDITMIFRLFA
jgi:hypothetical protein